MCWTVILAHLNLIVCFKTLQLKKNNLKLQPKTNMHLWHLQIVVFHHLIRWFAMTGMSIHVYCPIMLHNESSGLKEVCLKVADEVNSFCSIVFAATSEEIGKPKQVYHLHSCA